MGYRHYFYKVKKSEIEKAQNMTEEEMMSYAKEKGVYDVIEDYIEYYKDEFLKKEEIYEFGAINFEDRINSKGRLLFNNEKVRDLFPDSDFYIVGKEGVEEAINIYKEVVVNYYEELLEDSEYSKTYNIERTIFEISRKDFIDFENQYQVTNSWFREYAIFNLVCILKTFDFDNYDILFFGW